MQDIFRTISTLLRMTKPRFAKRERHLWTISKIWSSAELCLYKWWSIYLYQTHVLVWDKILEILLRFPMSYESHSTRVHMRTSGGDGEKCVSASHSTSIYVIFLKFCNTLPWCFLLALQYIDAILSYLCCEKSWYVDVMQ